jgi:hypothetical protein
MSVRPLVFSTPALFMYGPIHTKQRTHACGSPQSPYGHMHRNSAVDKILSRSDKKLSKMTNICHSSSPLFPFKMHGCFFRPFRGHRIQHPKSVQTIISWARARLPYGPRGINSERKRGHTRVRGKKILEEEAVKWLLRKVLKVYRKQAIIKRENQILMITLCYSINFPYFIWSDNSCEFLYHIFPTEGIAEEEGEAKCAELLSN